MCKVPVKLRELVKQRLAAAAEEIFELLERTITEYEEEAERQRRLMETLIQPRGHTTGVSSASPDPSPVLSSEWAPPLPPHFKEAPLPPHFKEAPLSPHFKEAPLPLHFKEAPLPPHFKEAPLPPHFKEAPLSPHIKEEQEEDIMTSQLSEREDTAPPSGLTEEGVVFQPRFSDYQTHLCDGQTQDEVRNLPQKRKICRICPFCGKAFAKTDNYKCHLRTHTGEKPFSCSVCGKRFGYHASFNNHRLLHSGERPYSCSVCGKDFALKIGLRQHMFTHNQQKPYSCSVCGKGFCVKQGLRKHLQSHGEDAQVGLWGVGTSSPGHGGSRDRDEPEEVEPSKVN